MLPRYRATAPVHIHSLALCILPTSHHGVKPATSKRTKKIMFCFAEGNGVPYRQMQQGLISGQRRRPDKEGASLLVPRPSVSLPSHAEISKIDTHGVKPATSKTTTTNIPRFREGNGTTSVEVHNEHPKSSTSPRRRSPFVNLPWHDYFHALTRPDVNTSGNGLKPATSKTTTNNGL